MIVLQFYPNGEFTQGVDTSKRRREIRDRKASPDSQLSRECIDSYLAWCASHSQEEWSLYTPGRQYVNKHAEVYTYLGEDSDGHWFDFACRNGVTYRTTINHPIGGFIARGEFIPLVHQSLQSSPAPKTSRKKLLTMTSKMARNIRNGVYLLENEYGKDCLSFLTLTLPNLSSEDLSIICSRWDYMVDQILKWLRKRLESAGVQFEYVYCTEIQMKRLESRGEYAPHLHIVFKGRQKKKGNWIITPLKVRNAWKSIIASVVGHVNFDTRALENLQRVKYSAARYLSKYLSKGKCSSVNIPEDSPVAGLRTQWGGMSRLVSRKIRRATTKLSGSGINADITQGIMRCMDAMVSAKIVAYFKRGYISLSKSAQNELESVLKVGVGALTIPALEGGLTQVFDFLQAWQG